MRMSLGDLAVPERIEDFVYYARLSRVRAKSCLEGVSASTIKCKLLASHYLHILQELEAYAFQAEGLAFAMYVAAMSSSLGFDCIVG